MSLRYDYMPLATAPENQPPAAELEEGRHADLERRFWKNVCLQPPLYGADIEGTLFDKDLKVPLAPPSHGPTPHHGWASASGLPSRRVDPWLQSIAWLWTLQRTHL